MSSCRMSSSACLQVRPSAPSFITKAIRGDIVIASWFHCCTTRAPLPLSLSPDRYVVAITSFDGASEREREMAPVKGTGGGCRR